MVHLRKFLTLVISTTLIIMFQSCDNYTIQYPEVEYNSFSETVQPIFDAKCKICHNGGLPPNLSEGQSHLALTQNGYINTDDPESSQIIQKLENENDHGGAGATPVDIAKILAWITAGAPND